MRRPLSVSRDTLKSPFSVEDGVYCADPCQCREIGRESDEVHSEMLLRNRYHIRLGGSERGYKSERKGFARKKRFNDSRLSFPDNII
jgi:hypothetical protein